MHKLKAYIPTVLAIMAALGLFLDIGNRSPLAHLASSPSVLTLSTGQHVDLDLDLIPLRRPPQVGACPTLSMHLRNDHGEIVRFFDHRLSRWLGPASEQEICIRDRTTLVQSLLDEPLPKGHYRLQAGLWDPLSRRKFRLRRDRPAGSGQEVQKRLTVAEVVVTGAREGAPQLTFNGGWGNPENGDFGSVRTRRPWFEAAEIHIRNVSTPIELRLVLDLVKNAVDPGRVMVDCTGELIALGQRWQELRLHVPATELGCRVVLPAVTGNQRQSGRLYALSWNPQPTAISPVELPSSRRAL